MFNKFLNYIIRKIKNDPSYFVDKSLTFYVFLCLIKLRGWALFKGTLFQILRARKLVSLFLGKGVIISYPKMLHLLGTVTLGNRVTLDCLGENGITLGRNVSIPDGCIIRCTGVISNVGLGVTIGNNSGLGHNNFINGQGGVVIGNDVIIGPFVSILSENHIFAETDVPIRLQGVSRVGIKIDSDVWIGANVTILDGVHIGRGSVIGAGSTVTKSIPEFSLAVGTPCRVLKNRSNNE